jgi:transposase
VTLRTVVKYKAQGRGVTVVLVDPRYTSQTCSGCGHYERANRPSQAVFSCVACGLSLHADLNASINIRAKFLQGLPVNQPIVSDASSLALRCKPPTSVGGC